MIFLSLNPILSANFRNSGELNGGPLSLFSSFGIPKIENVLSKSGITDFAVKLVKVSTTGYLEYSSISSIHWEKVHRSQCLIFLIHYLVTWTFVTVQMYSLGLKPGTVCMTYKSFQQVYRFLGYIPFHVIAVLSLLFPDDPDVQGQLHAFVNPWYNDSVIM